VFVADDDARFRGLLRTLIGRTPRLSLVGEAACGEDTLSPVARLLPDLVLMDVRMPGIGGIEAARTLLRRHPGLAVVLMSAQEPAPIATPGRKVTFVRKDHLCADVLVDLWRGRQTRSGPNCAAV
jgi:DNA-binding NarL/FixJ family response regulator